MYCLNKKIQAPHAHILPARAIARVAKHLARRARILVHACFNDISLCLLNPRFESQPRINLNRPNNWIEARSRDCHKSPIFSLSARALSLTHRRRLEEKGTPRRLRSLFCLPYLGVCTSTSLKASRDTSPKRIIGSLPIHIPAS